MVFPDDKTFNGSRMSKIRLFYLFYHEWYTGEWPKIASDEPLIKRPGMKGVFFTKHEIGICVNLSIPVS
jgi:hypothetical protein